MALLESSEADKFVAHLCYARKQYRVVCERPNKGNKAIERPFVEADMVEECATPTLRRVLTEKTGGEGNPI